MPDLDHGVGDRIAGGHINDLGVEEELDALLVFCGIIAHVFTTDIVRPLGNFRRENAGVVSGEDDRRVSSVCVSLGGQMSGVGNCGSIASLEVGSIY